MCSGVQRRRRLCRPGCAAVPLHVQRRDAVVAKPHPKGPCASEDCRRPFCEGYRLGYKEGYGAGYGAGYSDGYGEGYAAGSAAAG